VKGYGNIILAVTAAPLLALTSAHAQTVGIAKEANLAFGKIARSSGTATATARVRPNGAMNCNIRLICLGGQSAAQFRITGTLNSTVTIQSDTNISLVAPGGNTMNVVLELSTTLLTITLKKGNLLKVGGTLSVASQQAAGSYAGNFTITVDYQ
jgi:Mat/Ecp fimbriae major subunit